MVEQTLSKPKTIFLDPKSILKRLKIQAGQRVVDLGCGGGYFVIEAAREVGDNGLVYGVDVLPTVLSALHSRARLYGLFNIRTVWSNAEVHGGARAIKDGSVDFVLMIQLMSQSRKHEQIFKEASRMLKNGGKILIVDWRSDHGYRFGPPKENCIGQELVKQLADRVYWATEGEFEAGPYHYGLIFRK